MADFGGLRERADGGRGVSRQAQPGGLLSGALGVGVLAQAQVGTDVCHGGLHRRVVYAGRCAARCQCRLVGGKGVFRGAAPFTQGHGKGFQLFQLLQRVGQPGLHLGIELLFAVQVHRHMQQRAAGCYPQAVTQALCQRLQPVEHRVQVGLPDVAAIHHAQRQHLVRGQQAQQRHDVVAAVHCVDMQAGHGQVGGQVLVVLQLTEVGGQQ